MKRILIIDDSSFFRGLFKDIVLQEEANLFQDGLQIFEAEDEKIALQYVNEQKLDLIFLDIVMKDSELEGVEILQKIRAINPSVRVIILSSVGVNAVMPKCRDLGVQSYIKKPFDKVKLIKTIIKNL